jgi:hypothetical protein
MFVLCFLQEEEAALIEAMMDESNDDEWKLTRYTFLAVELSLCLVREYV